MQIWPRSWFKSRKSLVLADDTRVQEQDAQANDFYRLILFPDGEPAFVSDEATLRDVSLAPDEDLVRSVQAHYGTTLTQADFTKPFWSLLDDLGQPSSSQ